MQMKYQKYSKLHEYKALVEKGTGRKLKALKSDNSGEYVLNEFENFCASKGICWELITPHNPHKNGVVERKKESILGASQEMLHHQGQPLHLWEEA